MITRRRFIERTTAASLGLALYPGLIKPLFSAQRIRVGQIGTGHSHAEEKFQTLLKLDHLFEVVGLVENNPDLQQTARKNESYERAVWMSEEQLLATPGLQTVLVETDFNDLLLTAGRCIEAGMHVHIDKPPGNSLPDFQLLLQKAKEKSLSVQMGYMFRHHPAFQFCLGAVNQGLLGKVFEIQGVISKKIKQQRRQKLAATYGGAMMLLGCHLIDILIALLGEPRSVTSYRKQTYPAQDSLYDNELAVFDYPHCTAAIRSTLLEVEGQQRRQFVVCGEQGTLQIQPLEPAIVRLTLDQQKGQYRQGEQQIDLPAISGRYDAQLADFARQIRAEKKPEFSMQHDLIVHKSLLRACDIL